jgi:hypothetical protein
VRNLQQCGDREADEDRDADDTEEEPRGGACRLGSGEKRRGAEERDRQREQHVDPKRTSSAAENAACRSSLLARLGAALGRAFFESRSVMAARLLGDETNGPHVEAKLIELLARHEPERKRELRAVVREELAAVAEHLDVAQVEEQLVARL